MGAPHSRQQTRRHVTGGTVNVSDELNLFVAGISIGKSVLRKVVPVIKLAIA